MVENQGLGGSRNCWDVVMWKLIPRLAMVWGLTSALRRCGGGDKSQAPFPDSLRSGP